MIVLGSNETFANQNITSQKVLTFDTTPGAPSRQRIWFEVFFVNNANPDSQRTITFLTQNTGGTTDYGREFREVVNGDDANPHQVVIGPYIVPASTIIKLKIESDNAGDTDVNADVRMLIDDEHYRFTGRTAQDGVADSIERRIKDIGVPIALDGGVITLAGMLTKMADDNGGVDFDATTGSQQEIGTNIDLILADTGELQTNQGNWLTATGFSTHNAAAVWAVATRVLTANTNLNDLSAAEIRTALGLASANLDTQLGDIPTVAEFNARTLVAAAYFDPATDAVANVTTVGSVTTKTGYALTSAERNSIADATLNRGASNIEGTADKHSLGAVIMLTTNSVIAGAVWTAKKPSDDSTFFTYTVVVDASADPIIGVS